MKTKAAKSLPVDIFKRRREYVIDYETLSVLLSGEEVTILPAPVLPVGVHILNLYKDLLSNGEAVIVVCAHESFDAVPPGQPLRRYDAIERCDKGKHGKI